MAQSNYEKVKRYRERKSEASPRKPCDCGCGTLIPSINKSGMPARYAHGHNRAHQYRIYRRGYHLPPRSDEHRRKLSAALRGKKMPAETKAKISRTLMKPTAGRGAIHAWMRRHYPLSGICEECGERTRTEYASITEHDYTRNRSDYRELCRSCHLRYDLARGTRLSKQVSHRCADCGSRNVVVET